MQISINITVPDDTSPRSVGLALIAAALHADEILCAKLCTLRVDEQISLDSVDNPFYMEKAYMFRSE